MGSPVRATLKIPLRFLAKELVAVLLQSNSKTQVYLGLGAEENDKLLISIGHVEFEEFWDIQVDCRSWSQRVCTK